MKSLTDFKNVALEPDTLEIDKLSIADADDLFQLLTNNSTIKSLKINEVVGDPELLPIATLENLIKNNKTLTNIELHIDIDLNDTSILISALKNNIDILNFTVNSTLFNSEADPYLNRNQQLHFLVSLTIHMLIYNYDQLDPKDKPQEIGKLLSTLQSQFLKEKSFNELLDLLKSSFNPENPTNDSFINETNNAINHIEEYVTMCFKKELFTPLHIAAYGNDEDVIAPLLEWRRDGINAQDARGGTPLHYAITNLEMTKLLVDYGASPDIKDKNRLTPYMSAVLHNFKDTADYLKDKTKIKEDPEKIKLQRRLYFAFGGEKISRYPEGHMLAIESVTTAEAVETLSVYLERFLNVQPHDFRLPIIAKNISDAAKNTNLPTEEQLQKLDSEKLLLGFTGAFDHAVGFCILKQSIDYQLCIADRGAFMKLALDSNNPKLGRSIQSISVPEKKLPWVLDTLKESSNVSLEEAQKILFELIPSEVENEWHENTDFWQNPFKIGICAHGNLKTLLLNEFIKAYGAEKGYKLYKEFTLFLRKEILLDYKQYVAQKNTWDPFVMICQIILDEKEEKFTERFNPKPT